MNALIKELWSWLSSDSLKGSYDIVTAMVSMVAGKWDTECLDIQYIATIYNYLKPIGAALLLAYVLMEMYQAMTRVGGAGNTTPDMIVMPLLKFAIGYFLINEGLTIVLYFLSFSNGFLRDMESLLTIDPEIDFNGMTGDTSVVHSVTGLLGRVFFELIPSLISILSQILAAVIIAFQILTLRLEILIRLAFLPLGIANIAHDGPGGRGMAYVKRCFADMFILGGCIILVRLAYITCSAITFNGFGNLISGFGTGSFISGFFQTIIGFFLTSIVGPFVAVGAIQTLKSTVREAVAGM